MKNSSNMAIEVLEVFPFLFLPMKTKRPGINFYCGCIACSHSL